MARLRDINTGGGGGGGPYDPLGSATTVKTEVEADLTVERNAREASVAAEATTRTNADAAEKTAREAAVAGVASSISAETTDRKAEVKTEREERQTAVASETSARKIAVTAAESAATALVTTEEAARIAADATKISLSQKGAANGVAELDGSGKLPTSQLPALALTDPFVVNSQAEQLALSTHVGDIVVRTDTTKTYIRLNTSHGNMEDYQELLFPAPVVSVNTKTGAVSLTYTDVNADKAGAAASAQAAAELVSGAETTRAKAAEKVNTEAIEAETTRAKSAEETNSSAITTAKGEVATEKAARESGDSSEKTARETADSTEKSARETADATEKSARETAVSNEASARETADNLRRLKTEKVKTSSLHAWALLTPEKVELPGIEVEVQEGEKLFLVAVRYRTAAGENEVEVKRNGVGVTSLTALKAKTTAARTEANAGTPIELANGDYFTLNIKTLTETPKGLAVTLVLRSEA